MSPDQVRAIALDAFVSGIGTGVKSAAFNLAGGAMTPIEASKMARAAVNGFLNDPLQRLTIENVVEAIIAGDECPVPQGAAIPPTDPTGGR